jgi:Fe-S-cluster-containing dehydrogenase component
MVNKRVAIVDVDLCVGCQSCMFACNRRFGEAGLSKSAIHITSAGGFERGFVVIVCRACDDPPCAKVCPTNALKKRKYGGVILDSDKCIGCQNCVQACDIGAIFWDKESVKPVVCTYCGICIDYCPYGVIEIESVKSGSNDNR